MQLSVNVQLPENLGGLNGQCVYIDTEGSFISKRVIEIAKATIKMLKLKDFNTNNLSVEGIMSNIFYFRCIDHVQLIATINNMSDFLTKHPKVKLIVVDSLANPFRFTDFKDSNSTVMKTNLLNNFMTNAYDLVTKYNLAVSYDLNKFI